VRDILYFQMEAISMSSRALCPTVLLATAMAIVCPPSSLGLQASSEGRKLEARSAQPAEIAGNGLTASQSKETI